MTILERKQFLLDLFYERLTTEDVEHRVDCLTAISEGLVGTLLSLDETKIPLRWYIDKPFQNAFRFRLPHLLAVTGGLGKIRPEILTDDDLSQTITFTGAKHAWINTTPLTLCAAFGYLAELPEAFYLGKSPHTSGDLHQMQAHLYLSAARTKREHLLPKTLVEATESRRRTYPLMYTNDLLALGRPELLLKEEKKTLHPEWRWTPASMLHPRAFITSVAATKYKARAKDGVDGNMASTLRDDPHYALMLDPKDAATVHYLLTVSDTGFNLAKPSAILKAAQFLKNETAATQYPLIREAWERNYKNLREEPNLKEIEGWFTELAKAYLTQQSKAPHVR